MIKEQSENHEQIFNTMNELYLTLTDKPLRKIEFKK